MLRRVVRRAPWPAGATPRLRVEVCYPRPQEQLCRRVSVCREGSTAGDPGCGGCGGWGGGWQRAAACTTIITRAVGWLLYVCLTRALLRTLVGGQVFDVRS